MAEVIVLFKVENKPVKEKVKKELNWYDIIKKEMQVFYGGKLGFEYKEDEYLISLGEEERKRIGRWQRQSRSRQNKGGRIRVVEKSVRKDERRKSC